MRLDLYATNKRGLFSLFLPNRILIRAIGGFQIHLDCLLGGTFQPLHACNLYEIVIFVFFPPSIKKMLLH